MASRNEDGAMAGLLRRSLSSDPKVGDPCPEPDILAAYFERSLEAKELAQCDLHFSRCSRCREQLAAMARADEAVPPDRKRTSWVWDWRWLAATAAIVTLVLYLSVGRPGRRVATSPSAEQPLLALSEPNQGAIPNRETPPESSSPAPPSTPTASQTAPAPKPSGPNRVVEEKKQAPLVAPDAAKQRETATDLPLNGRDNAALQSLKKAGDRPPADDSSGQVGGVAAPLAGGASPASPTPKAEAPAAPAAPSAKSNTFATAQRLRSNSEARLSEPGADALNPVAGTTQPATVTAVPTDANLSDEILINTPNQKVLWRITAGSFIEHSTNGGATWQGQLPDQAAQLTAGSSPSAKVCWLVGRSGAILVTKDAMKWKKVPPPIPADFTAVTAKNASEATVTTVDGQKFVTSDGGKKWKPAP